MCAAVEKAHQGFLEFAANLAADAAGIEKDDVGRYGFDELLVDADFAEFVDEYGAVAIGFGGKDFFEDGGFAGTKKAGSPCPRGYHPMELAYERPDSPLPFPHHCYRFPSHR